MRPTQLPLPTRTLDHSPREDAETDIAHLATDPGASPSEPAPLFLPEARRLSGLVTRNVRASIGTAVRIRLLAAARGVPVAHALLHAAPAFVATEAPLRTFPTVRRSAFPTDRDQFISIALASDTWAALDELARQHGVGIARILDSAAHPHLQQVARMVTASVEDVAR